nr:hypothetical protein CFP56_60917 [Quercus suber]POE77269.1 hypothetical protein CFP56_29771 [Quercus suber]
MPKTITDQTNNNETSQRTGPRRPSGVGKAPFNPNQRTQSNPAPTNKLPSTETEPDQEDRVVSEKLRRSGQIPVSRRPIMTEWCEARDGGPRTQRGLRGFGRSYRLRFA